LRAKSGKRITENGQQIQFSAFRFQFSGQTLSNSPLKKGKNLKKTSGKATFPKFLILNF